MARLVLTHSTYIEGLIKWLRILSKEEKIQTITPGCINKTKGRSNKLKIKISRKTNEGYRLIARKGSTVQEVYIICKLDTEELNNLIQNNNPE